MRLVRSAMARAEALAGRSPRLGALLHDRVMRASAFTTCGLVANVTYAVWNLVLGMSGGSVWFVTMGCVYFSLAVMRFLAVQRSVAARAGDEGASRSFTRKVGINMLGLAVVLSFAVRFTIERGAGAVGNEIVVITQATYTFLVVSLAVTNVVRARLLRRDVERVLRSVAFVAAIVSLLSLQTTMIDTFGRAADFRFVATALAGAGACLGCAAVGVSLMRGQQGLSQKPRHLTNPEA